MKRLTVYLICFKLRSARSATTIIYFYCIFLFQMSRTWTLRPFFGCVTFLEMF